MEQTSSIWMLDEHGQVRCGVESRRRSSDFEKPLSSIQRPRDNEHEEGVGEGV